MEHTIEISPNGTTGWTVVSEVPTYVIQAGDVGKYLRISAVGYNSTATVAVLSAVSGPIT